MRGFEYALARARSLYREIAICIPPQDYDFEEAMKQFQFYGTRVAMYLRDTNTIGSNAAIDLAMDMITAGQHETAEVSKV